MAALDLERLAQRLREDPRSLAFVALADGMRKAGRADEAWAALGKGLEHHPDLPSARLVVARLHHEAGRGTLATEILIEVVLQDPANDAARSLLVNLLLEHGRVAEARGQLRALKMTGAQDGTGVAVNLPDGEAAPPPDDPFACSWLIERCLSGGDFARALAIAARAHCGADHPAVTERLSDLKRAALGTPVGWVDALPERDFRGLPHRLEVVAALREEQSRRPPCAERVALSAVLWPQTTTGGA
ncbi:MAG: tetratricopeptide repeat protein [Myxococcales bacterium]|nr:tetratricopeptide repeat protein [Myxococcales bacterium]